MNTPETPPSVIQRLFVWLAGADISCLQQCPRWERIKYEAFGASALVPASLGIISSAYAVSTLTDSKLMIVSIALVIGSIIIAIDRVLHSTFRAYDNVFKKLTQFALRLMIAVVLGAAVAYPITLLLFKQTIQQQVQNERAKKIREIRLAAGSNNFEYQNRIDTLSNKLEDLQKQYDRTLTNGLSLPVSKAYDELFTDIDSRLANLKSQRKELSRKFSQARADTTNDFSWWTEDLNRISAEIADLTSRRIRLSTEFTQENETMGAGKSTNNQALLIAIHRQIDAEGSNLKRQTFEAEQMAIQTAAEISEIQDQYRIDILSQTMALQEILSQPKQKSSQFTLIVFVTLIALFVFFDTLPILIKSFSAAGPYDMLQHMESSKYDVLHELKSKEELLDIKERSELFQEQMALRMSLFHSLDNLWDEHVLQLPQKQARIIDTQSSLDIESEEIETLALHHRKPAIAEVVKEKEADLDSTTNIIESLVMQTVAEPVVQRKRRKKSKRSALAAKQNYRQHQQTISSS